MPTAWDGTAQEFWLSVARHRGNVELESDAAVLSEVLDIAQRALERDATHAPLKCTCGSGGHPRDCAVHPQGKELHALEISYEGLRDDVRELVNASRKAHALWMQLQSQELYGEHLREMPEFDELYERLAKVGAAVNRFNDEDRRKS